MIDMDRVKRFLKTPLFWIILIVLILLCGVAVAGFYQYRRVTSELTKIKETPTGGQLTDERQRELITEVAAKIMLPADEKPTVAVVSDINRLKDQQFFTSGQNGDVVLIYMNSKKAILYRPSEKKIIEVAPVNLSNNEASISGEQVAGATDQNTPQVSPTPTTVAETFVLRNGTNITGLARSFEDKLAEQFPGAKVVERANAANRNYTTTLLVDVSGTKSAIATQIATALGVTTGPLPVGEIAPANADFLVIIGSDGQ